MVTATISASGLVHFMVLPPKVELRSTVASTGEWVKPPSRASHPPDHTNGNADPMPNAGIMPALLIQARAVETHTCSVRAISRSHPLEIRWGISPNCAIWPNGESEPGRRPRGGGCPGDYAALPAPRNATPRLWKLPNATSLRRQKAGNAFCRKIRGIL